MKNRETEIKNIVHLKRAGTTICYPGEYGYEFITIYTNDWATTYQIKLRGRKPFLKFFGRERAYR